MEAIALDELVELAMRRNGCEKPVELAQLLGFDGVWSGRRVQRWIEGKAVPTYDATLRLLALAGLLLDPQPVEGPAGPFEAHLATTIAKMDRLLSQHTRMLGELVGKIDALQEGLAQAPRGEAAGRGSRRSS